jgi:hypothetical protein
MIRLERTSRWPRVPIWAACIVGAWAAFVLATWIVNHYLARPIELCAMRHFTGHPCPTCGSTRLVMSLIRGDVARAMWFNPFVFAAMIGMGLMLSVRMVFARQPMIRWTQRRRWVGIGLLLAAMGASWVYQWCVVG